jgi:deoxyadenosine/deoxycytidine kinase
MAARKGSPRPKSGPPSPPAGKPTEPPPLALKKPVKTVAVAGTIGAGKTSLVAWLTKTYGLTPYYEPNDTNPYLADFYGDMRRWAFPSQAYFLAHKLELHQKLEQSPTPAVIDRTIYEDAEIFARNLYLSGNMEERDWQLYDRLYQGILRSLQPPDILIAVTCSLPVTKKRIKRRGRAMEQAIPDAYLRNLDRAYRAWFDRWTLSPVLTLDTTKLAYMEDLLDLIDVRARLDKVLV